jgi:hypothetical protein
VHNIKGRSTMNKDELQRALGKLCGHTGLGISSAWRALPVLPDGGVRAGRSEPR